MQRNPHHRATENDPAVRSALFRAEVLEPSGDEAGLHAEPAVSLERLLDREERTGEEATAGPRDRIEVEPPADPHVPEDLPGVEIALATQGGGSFLGEDAEHSLESHLDRDALASGIVPQMVSQSTIESAASPPDETLEDEETVEDELDEEAPTLPRARDAQRATRHARKPR